MTLIYVSYTKMFRNEKFGHFRSLHGAPVDTAVQAIDSGGNVSE